MPALLLTLSVFAPVAAAVLGLLLPRKSVGLRVAVATLGPLVAFVALVAYMALFGEHEGPVLAARWVPAIHMDLLWHADPLGLFFGLLVSGVGTLIALYGRAYLGPDPRSLQKLYGPLGLFMTAMMGLSLADQTPTLLLFWEMTSISSFLLIGWDTRDKTAVKNAVQAFTVTGFGGLVLLGGILLLAQATGTWQLSQMPPMTGGGLAVAALACVFVGVATKSAQFPLHFWLPGAMAAPTPISAYLHSAAMVKAGIYLLARLWPTLGELPLWPILAVGFGGATMAYGAVMALRQDVLKSILAYTTISQLGLLAAAFGLAGLEYEGEPNLIWGNLQIANHALYKAPLFILAGALAHALHKKKLSDCLGLWHGGGDGKLYAALFLAAGYALAAGPLTLSFAAKEFFLYQIVHAHKVIGGWFWPLAGAAILTSVCNVALLVRFGLTFFCRSEHGCRATTDVFDHPVKGEIGSPAVDHSVSVEEEDHPFDKRFWHVMLWVPAAVLLLGQVLGGVAPFLYTWFFPEQVVGYAKFAEGVPSILYFLLNPGWPLLMSGMGIAGGLLLGFSPIVNKAGPGRPVWRERVNFLFDGTYAAATNGGRALFGLVQTGHFRTYALFSAAALIFAVSMTWWSAGEWPWARLPRPIIEPAGLLIGGGLLTLLLLGCILVMPVIRDRLVRVLVLGVIGFGLTGLFYIYQGPDLALTQISVEIVSLILFLLVLGLLPESPNDPRGRVWLRLPVAIGFGLVMGTLAYSAASGPAAARPVALGDDPGPVGQYHLRNSYYGVDAAAVSAPGVIDRGLDHLTSFGTKVKDGTAVELGEVAHKGGGGNNVVNVILVDFRAFDTLGELVVLGLAAMGVWTLLRSNPHEAPTGGRNDETDPLRATHRERRVQMLISSPILRQAAGLLVPLTLVFATFVFFKGHQSPGGGFVGGLVASVALVVYRMTFGCDALYRLLPVRERTLIAAGLGLGLGSGLVGWLMGLPLLTTNHGYLPLPGGGEFHWATVLVFDLGVVLVVVGTVVGIIDVLTRELEQRHRARGPVETGEVDA